MPPGARRLHWGEPDAELVAISVAWPGSSQGVQGCDDYRMSRHDDSEDWFAESARERRRPHDEPPAEYDWVRDDTPVTRVPRRALLRGMPRARQIALGAGAVAAVLLVLWAAGARVSHSSSHSATCNNAHTREQRTPGEASAASTGTARLLAGARGRTLRTGDSERTRAFSAGERASAGRGTRAKDAESAEAETRRCVTPTWSCNELHRDL